MTTPFTITTPTNAILLDTDRRGLVVFTVANQTGRSLRVRMSVSPFAPASADWFKVEGEAERLLPLGSSDTGTVRIAVPPDVAPGPQNFRLDVVSVERPDEEWAHGPAVGFQIPAPPPPKPEPSPATGYVETTAGAVAGAIAGILVAAIASLAVWALSGRVDTVLVFFRQVFTGGFVAGAVLGGGIGVFAALSWRSVPPPEPLPTAAAYVVAAFVVAMVLQLILLLAIPARVLVFGTAVFRVPEPSDGLGAGLSVLLALIAAALAALAARAFTRWRLLGRI